MESKPLLSIIVTSYTTKRLKDIFELLDSIGRQTYPNIETIFVAERSRMLYDKVGAHLRKIPDSKIIFNDGQQGLSAARNLGIPYAKGDIISFVDDDAILFKDWAKEMVSTYRDLSIIGVTGPSFPLWDDPSMKWFPEEFHWMFSCSTWIKANEIMEIRNVWGNNFSFRREAFEKAGFFSTKHGFPKGTYEGFLGEDNELSMRVKHFTGEKIVLNPNARILHKVHAYRLQWPFVIKRSYNMGRSRRLIKNIPLDADNLNLEIEHSLLKNIIFKLPIRITKKFFQKPTEAMKILIFSLVILSFVGLGYLRLEKMA